MNDIQLGDVVVCVDASPHRGSPEAPRLVLGRAYRVDGQPSTEPDEIVICGMGSGGWRNLPYQWAKRRFRPLNDGEDDANLIARIRACKPARSPTLEPIQTLPVSIQGCGL